MYYIGVIGINDYLNIHKIIKNKNLQLVLLDSINNNEKINFDIVVINDKSKITNEILRSIGEVEFLFLNSDDRNEFFGSISRVSKLLTYGFNSKSTVTISSLTIDICKNLQFCIQRKIRNLKKHLLEEQEFGVIIRDINIDNYIILISIAILMVCGESSLN